MTSGYSEIIGSIITSAVTCIMNLASNRKYTSSKAVKEKYEDIQKQFLINLERRQEDVINEKYLNISLPRLEDMTSDLILQPLLDYGAYSSIEHYLKIQSNLVREDFLIPFRNTINMFQKGSNLTSISGVYKNVHFIEETLIRSKLCVVINIKDEIGTNSSLLPPESNNLRKEFMYGSLLCFSCDNFSSIIFATVEDQKDISNGYLIICPCEVSDASKISYNADYYMIESEVYFEPYYHILSALGQFNEENFPLADYIIKAQPKSQFPRYALDILNFVYKGKELSILDTEAWPKPEEMGLNISQLEAIKAVLTNEVVLIQGPPGTGKTFVSIEIASILIKNIKRPHILIVCYTNQALDQFLSGLTSVTKSIIRVGNQSAEPGLAEYNINKQYARSNTLNKALRQIQSEILQILKDIKTNQQILKTLNSYEGILCMDNNKYAAELQDKNWLPKSSTLLSSLANWLLGCVETVRDLPQCKKKDYYKRVDKVTHNQESLSDSNAGSSAIFEPLNDLDIHLDDLNLTSELSFDITVGSLQKSLSKLNEQIEKLSSQCVDDEYLIELAQEKENLKFWLHHLTTRMNIGPTNDKNIVKASSGESLSFQERWNLYWHWLDLIRGDYISKSATLNVKYERLLKQYEELKFIHYINILKDVQIIGMTTTSAARLKVVLEELKIPIVILEEAAEVSEAHAVASLTKYCEHLIMIGDHKQLQPRSAVYELSEKYNLKISLFERLLNNGIHCTTLSEQYRMRPEIASLISPLFYNNLSNNNSVTVYPNVKGMVKNLYFITHSNFEDMQTHSTSYSNIYEAKFVVKLCQYLLLNSCDASDITILTTYLAQLTLIRSEMRKISLLRNVKAAVVDNYQGQQNKIILLSLVRSTEDGNIGFMSKQNRICVALSRAMQGLYIVGNMNNFASSSKIWSNIEEILKSQNSIGEYLQLRFQKKSSILEFKAHSYEDFDLAISHLQ